MLATHFPRLLHGDPSGFSYHGHRVCTEPQNRRAGTIQAALMSSQLLQRAALSRDTSTPTHRNPSESILGWLDFLYATPPRRWSSLLCFLFCAIPLREAIGNLIMKGWGRKKYITKLQVPYICNIYQTFSFAGLSYNI